MSANQRSRHLPILWVRNSLSLCVGAACVALSGCVVRVEQPAPVQHPAPPVYVPPPVVHAPPQPRPVQEPRIVYAEPAPVVVEVEPPVTRVYYEPPVLEVEPIVVPWAPPPMLWEPPPPPPAPDFYWVGGYWVWQDGWVWAIGRWMRPPHHDYHWEHPYYEHRGNGVIFVPGHWDRPEHHFEPPAPEREFRRMPTPRVQRPGRAPEGPQGTFVPPPPGSRAGLIVPAPLGTAPAVVSAAPAIAAIGMRIEESHDNRNRPNGPQRNGDRDRNFTIVAPPGSTANGGSFNAWVPGAPHLAAGTRPPPSTPAPATPVFTAPARPMPAQTAPPAPSLAPPAPNHPAPAVLSAPSAPPMVQMPAPPAAQVPAHQANPGAQFMLPARLPGEADGNAAHGQPGHAPAPATPPARPVMEQPHVTPPPVAQPVVAVPPRPVVQRPVESRPVEPAPAHVAAPQPVKAERKEPTAPPAPVNQDQGR